MERLHVTMHLARRISLVLVAAALAAPVARAQAKSDDAFAKAMFDPQLVLKNAQAIGLTAAQRKSILDEMRTTQTALAPLQIDMAEPAIELQELLEAPRVDEAKALAKIDQVLKVENEVKKRQAAFIIRVKNILTPEQQSKLRSIRDGGGKDGDALNENAQDNSSERADVAHVANAIPGV